MIFGYEPLRAEYDFQSSNLNPERWMISKSLASINWDRKENEKLLMTSEESVIFYFMFESHFQK